MRVYAHPEYLITKPLVFLVTAFLWALFVATMVACIAGYLGIFGFLIAAAGKCLDANFQGAVKYIAYSVGSGVAGVCLGFFAEEIFRAIERQHDYLRRDIYTK